MCGIAGIIEAGASPGGLERLCAAMTDSMRARGPDDRGLWSDAEAGIALGQRRLSIVDLSPAGHQPMISASGRFVLTYNGEVYNAGELAEELRPSLEAAGVEFRGHSDTEVILEACAAWGVEKTVSRLIGMFAFALWDRRERELVLVRDRLGIKPLYWGVTAKGALLFGSELKALRRHPDCPTEIDRDAVAAFLRRNYVPGPRSIHLGIQKLQPGRILRFAAGAREPAISEYWRLDDVVEAGRADPFTGSDQEALEQLEALLGDAVGRRMVADVPLGAFLSGGIDSSVVVAMMQAQSDRPVRSFSIGFNEDGFNEAKHAKVVAEHLGTDHTELYVTPEEAQAVIPDLPTFYDEPFSDSSQIPTYLVSALARRHVTVALSGDGGDELFAGYNRYFQARRFGATLGMAPAFMRRAAGAAIRSAPPSWWDAAFRLAPASRRPKQAGDKMHKLASVLDLDDDGFYRRLISHWTEPDALVIGGREPRDIIWDPAARERAPDFIQRMQYLDTLTYLPDDILTKVDRASMAASLEARVPLLDHRVVAFSWRLPERMKIRGGQGKWLLRQLLYKHVPQKLVDRPKMGFGVPIDSWLRGPLREWAEDLLSEATFRRHGLLHAAPVREKWRDHLSGRRNWQYLLWDVLMLHAWADAWRGEDAAAREAAPAQLRASSSEASLGQAQS